jgi:copper chaperone CopZ
MKIVLFAILVGLAMSHTPILAQTKDSVVQFKVYGNCEQCKARIEKAAKIKGVKKADWNVDSKMLSLVFNPSMVSVETVQNKILSAGHDVENKKATNAAYYQLPGCCQYRKETPGIEKDTLIQQSGKDTANKTFKSKVVKGVVVEETKKGVFKPLSGANVIWLENRAGSLTNTEGIFTMNTFEGGMHLIVSYAGFSPDTILVNNTDGLRIILAANKMLSEVTVTSKLRADYLSSLTPVRTEIITDKELLKAACCNLSESFETNPSVDVTYNDAVTGTKQIQLLGLSGNYTQLTVENLPGPRGIATPWGLNYIAGPWIESIQLSKGVGSVVNGYESIAGQINIQLKQPSEKEKLSVNAYVNDFGKTDFNLLLSKMINKNWSSALLVHDDYFGNKNLDMNHDGFRDLPTGNLFAVLNRWEYINKNGLQFHGGIKWVNDNKIGGQVNFNPSVDKFTTNSYGLGILANREEAYAKIGYIFPAIIGNTSSAKFLFWIYSI